MKFVKELGEQYLWVDALCIIQDHPEKADLLGAMDNVYNRAAWCLVAASAEDADTPLPRFEKKSKVTYQQHRFTAIVKGMELATLLPPLEKALLSSKWFTRAWTYQEGILSTRIVFMFHDQIRFNCCHGFSYCEDISFESGKCESKQISGQLYVVDTRTNFEIFADAVEDYTTRKLSYQEDAINAFAGVLAVLKTPLRGDFLYGLPDTELDQALLWQPASVLHRRKNQHGNLPFPSWSWAGWAGGVTYWPNLALSRVKWKDALTNDYFTSSQFRRPYSAVSGDAWFQEEWAKGYPGRTDKLEESWMYDLCYYEKSNPAALFLHPISKSSDSGGWECHTHIRFPSQHLGLKCMSAQFKLSGEHADVGASATEPCVGEKHIVCALKIFDSSGRLAGTVHIPSSLGLDIRPGTHEFICLSRTHLMVEATSAVKMRPFDDEFDDKIEYECEQDASEDTDSDKSILGPEDYVEFDIRAFDATKPWCIYNVMLVDTTNGISQRIGLGRVHMDAFLGEEHTWKDIVLR